jgi:hypothetical protein
VKPEPPWKTLAWRILFALLLVWVVSGAAITFVIWAFNFPEERFGRHILIHEGQRCGPAHHWVYVGPMGDSDLSCEPNR